MDSKATCKQCLKAFKSRSQRSKVHKYGLQSFLRKTTTSVHAAMQMVYHHEGTCDGHVCQTCYVQLERDFRVYDAMPSAIRCPPMSTPTKGATLKRKVVTPRTPRPPSSLKRVRTSPARPTAPRVLAFMSTPHANKNSARLSFHLSPVLSTSHILKPKRETRTLRIFTALHHGRYNSALKLILNSKSKAVMKTFTAAVHRLVKTELNAFVKESMPSMGSITSTVSINSFSWDKLIKKAAEKMPTLYAAVCAGVGMTSPTSPESERCKKLQPRIGLLLAVSLFTKRPRTFKMVQSLCGLQLWRSGCSEKVFTCLNKLGVCLSKTSTRRLVDYLCTQVDIDLKAAKDALEQEGLQKSARSRACASQKSTIKSISFIDSDDDEEFFPPVEILEESLNSRQGISMLSDISGNVSNIQVTPGYAFVWDNIQKLSQTRDSSYGRGNKMHMWANAFVVFNRVQPQGLDDLQQLPASDIPLSAYLPSEDDGLAISERMQAIVGRILVNHLKCFREYGDVATWHIPHRYSEEMKEKSKIINYGIIHENPSTRAGTMAIMRHLQKNVPKQEDGSYLVVPCHGDGLSIERMTDGKKACAAGLTRETRLEGLEQTAQEFHHRGLMLQDTMNKMFHGGSIGERGTLAHLRNAFQHRNATTNVMSSFNAVENLVRFSTEAHVIYLAMVILGLDDIHGTPADMQDLVNPENRRAYLEKLCRKIVKVVWKNPPPEQVATVIEADLEGVDKWCSCREDGGGELIRCSNPGCPLGIWYHLMCVGLDGIPEGDWWCSVECHESGGSMYCFCRKLKCEDTIECSAGVECTQGQFFHVGCINPTEHTDEQWYCSPECGHQQPDYQRNYTVTLLWYGLLDLVHRDAIREGDGPGMMSCWRLNMVRFWEGNHYKYLIIGHRLLAGMNGWLEPRLIEEIQHNRTCNLTGGPGHNIPMDRVNEFLNNEFKEILLHSHGNYTDKTVNRAGRMVGSLAKAIDEAFQVSLAETGPVSSYRKRHDYQDDIEKFIEELWDDQLFTEHPGRAFPTFPGFKCPDKISRPLLLKKRFIKYNKNLDRYRRVNDDDSDDDM